MEALDSASAALPLSLKDGTRALSLITHLKSLSLRERDLG